jgi:plastocyanin
VTTKTVILPLLAIAAIGVAGCGGGSSNSSGGASSGGGAYSAPKATATATAAQATATATAAQAPAENAGGAIAVNIANFAFAPADIQAKVGQKITFTNQDSTAHTATATSGATFDSGSLAQGKSFTFTPKKAGTIQFVCSFHPNMVGTITVS